MLNLSPGSYLTRMEAAYSARPSVAPTACDCGEGTAADKSTATELTKDLVSSTSQTSNPLMAAQFFPTLAINPATILFVSSSRVTPPTTVVAFCLIPTYTASYGVSPRFSTRCLNGGYQRASPGFE